MLDQNEMKVVKGLEEKEGSIWVWNSLAVLLMACGLVMNIAFPRLFEAEPWKGVIFGIIGVWITASGLMVMGIISYQMKLYRIIKKLLDATPQK